jgi:hypothetical protein
MRNEATVTVGFDALAGRRRIYWFTVNPLGTQSEEIPGGAASKLERRSDWQAATQRTATGWRRKGRSHSRCSAAFLATVRHLRSVRTASRPPLRQTEN